MAEPARDRRPNRPPVKFREGCMIFGNTTLGHTSVKFRSRRRPEAQPAMSETADSNPEDVPEPVSQPAPEVDSDVLYRAQRILAILADSGVVAPAGTPEQGKVLREEAIVQFVARHRCLAELRGFDLALPKIVFHWTQEKNFAGIAREGLRVPDGAGVAVAHGSSFGNGIYVSPEFRYGKELFAYGARAAFMCLALPGKQHFGKPPSDGTGFLSPGDEGYDSVIGREGQRGIDEWVFFRQDQLLLCFLVDELGLVMAKEAAFSAIKVLHQPWPQRTEPATPLSAPPSEAQAEDLRRGRWQPQKLCPALAAGETGGGKQSWFMTQKGGVRSWSDGDLRGEPPVSENAFRSPSGKTVVETPIPEVMHVIPLGMALLVVTYSRLMVLMIWRKYVPEAPKSLLRPMSLTTDHDPERKEDVLVLLTCFRESKQELAHSISTLRDTQTSARLMVFVDGLQRVNMDTITKMAGAAGGDVEIATHECTDDKKLEMNQGPVPEEMATLASLLSLLPSGRVLQEHGCVCIRGEIEASTPYEIYVKGPGCPQSKRASHALCMSILHADFDAGRPNPKAVLLLDGDCRVEPAHLGEMFRCLQEQDLAACGPWPVPEKVHTSCLLAQAVRDVIMHPLGWMGQSAARFVFPLRGSCAMYSIEAVRAVQSDYCEGVREESVLDSMMIENGEDSYMTNLVHEKCPGNGIRFLPHCHATRLARESVFAWELSI
ncbi:nipblb [Symbiodinium pilosum]|uniref:Nipblb protein n=1 Tax=Symbiodinium pilosum TaxID=2952 RepID=A0A812XGU4_SYMPI|nr:nipblb [Symbiodinium pilosum]